MSETSFRFEKKYRLKKSLEIKSLFQGQRSVIKPFVVFKKFNDKKIPRMAITLTRKTGNSVDRNSIKRKFREWFRLHKSKLKSYDILFYSNFDLSGFNQLEKRKSNSKFWDSLFFELSKE